MPPADGLGVDGARDVANDAILNEELSQEEIVRAIPQHVADGKDLCALQGPEGVIDLEAVLEVGGQRLLAHDVQPQRGQANDDITVQLVQHADKGAVDALGDVLFASRDALPALGLVLENSRQSAKDCPSLGAPPSPQMNSLPRTSRLNFTGSATAATMPFVAFFMLLA